MSCVVLGSRLLGRHLGGIPVDGRRRESQFGVGERVERHEGRGGRAFAAKRCREELPLVDGADLAMQHGPEQGLFRQFAWDFG